MPSCFRCGYGSSGPWAVPLNGWAAMITFSGRRPVFCGTSGRSCSGTLWPCAEVSTKWDRTASGRAIFWASLKRREDHKKQFVSLSIRRSFVLSRFPCRCAICSACPAPKAPLRTRYTFSARGTTSLADRRGTFTGKRAHVIADSRKRSLNLSCAYFSYQAGRAAAETEKYCRQQNIPITFFVCRSDPESQAIRQKSKADMHTLDEIRFQGNEPV